MGIIRPPYAPWVGSAEMLPPAIRSEMRPPTILRVIVPKVVPAGIVAPLASGTPDDTMFLRFTTPLPFLGKLMLGRV
jgi:hypothetical protein